MNNPEEIVSQLSGYGSLILNSLYFMIAGMLVIFLLYKLASRFLNRFLYAQTKARRLFTVIFGALYVLVLVVTGLLVLRNLGFEISAIGELAILVVLIGAVVAFFLVPFLPKLPFVVGHMVEINGVIGIVDSISTFHTQLRTFDGNIVFIPNALVMASRIINYHQTPNRRIQLQLSVGVDCDLARCQQALLEIMQSDGRVLPDPAPVVFVMNANAAGVEMTGYCWVENNYWLAARSDLWMSAVDRFQHDPAIELSLDKQEVLLSGELKNVADPV